MAFLWLLAPFLTLGLGTNDPLYLPFVGSDGQVTPKGVCVLDISRLSNQDAESTGWVDLGSRARWFDLSWWIKRTTVGKAWAPHPG